MELRFAFFCEAASMDSLGRLSVLGIFDNLNAHKFPAVHPQMTFVAAIEGHRSEIGKHQLRINFVDEDGKELIPPLETNFEISSKSLIANALLQLNNIKIPHPGTYSADIVIDNRHCFSCPICSHIALVNHHLSW